MAKSPKSELAQHTDALKAHTVALKAHEIALTRYATALRAIAATSVAPDCPPAGTRIWTDPDCDGGRREYWVADGRCGYEKKYEKC